jgi:hypothetical protein
MSGTLGRAGLSRALAQRSIAEVAVGGDTWSVSRPGGNGVSGPRSSASAGTVTGYAYQEQPADVVVNVAGTPLPNAPWRFMVVSGAVQPGDTITSAASATIKFTVRAPDANSLWTDPILEPVP